MRSIVAKSPAHGHVSGHLHARGCGRGVAQADRHWAGGCDDMASGLDLMVPVTPGGLPDRPARRLPAHVGSIFARLGLPTADDDHRHGLAVLV
jgi:hypothetical protein